MVKPGKHKAVIASKELENYNHSKPHQLDFFELVEPDEQCYSNTIEFYDAVPKYIWRSEKRDKGGNLKPVIRNFVHKKEEFTVTIQPASIQQKNGDFIDIFPGIREELVEDALRKLASTGSGVFLDDNASVKFTLYQLQQELKRMGHSHSLMQIKESITVCSKSHMVIKERDGRGVLMSSYFPTVGLTTKEDWKGVGKKTTAYITFNSLVTQSIKKRTFRLLNYDKSMSYKRVLARWMHKRLSHNYTQASLQDFYTITLMTIIRDSGVTKYQSLRNNIVQVKEALDEMKEKQTIVRFDTKNILDGRKIVDAKFNLWAHPEFISEVIKSNRRKGRSSSQEVAAFYELHRKKLP